MRLVAEIEDALAALAEQDPQALLRVAPLVQHEVAGERLDRDDPPPAAVGDEFGSTRLARRSARSSPEVLGVEVGEDDERSPQWSTEYSMSSARGRTTMGVARCGSSAGISETSRERARRRR